MNKHEKLLEDIYDLIKGGEFEAEAKKNIRAFIKHKHIEWDNQMKTISLGRDFKIKLISKEKHKLIIKSLHDGQAECSCGHWWYTFTGERTKSQIRAKYRKHLKDYK